MMMEHIGLDEPAIHALAASYEQRSPQDVLRWALERFGSRLAICTSFQADGMVVLDMAWRLDPTVRVFTIDTGRLPQDTYTLIDTARDHYQTDIEVYFPDAVQVESVVRRHGMNLFYQDIDLRRLCCHTRKVLPLRRVLSSLDAWVTGLRRDQLSSRAGIQKVEADHDHGGLVKLNPLADWTEGQVWDYVRAHRVPVHPFYEQGYSSIGCEPCTRPISVGEDHRAGRWWWENGALKECGMHCSIESGRFQREYDAVQNRDGEGI